MSLFEELKRRNVFRIGIAYLVASWLLLQIIDVVSPILQLPETIARYILFLLVAGFIPVLILAWVLELTPDGVKLESEVSRTLDRAIVVILVFAVGFLLFDKMNQDVPLHDSQESVKTARVDSTEAPTAVPVEKSVAVLPLVAMSNGPDDDYYADGLTEEILNTLTQLPGLLVTARTSAFHFKGKNLPTVEIARELGVDHVVEGSVRRAGDQLRITAQLIRAEDGFQLWSQTYDRRTEETFVVRSDIAEKVAGALNVFLDDSLRKRVQWAGTRNVEALIAFQKGIELYDAAHREPSQISLLRQANAQFENAIANTPDFFEAYHHHSALSSHILISHAAGELDGNITAADLQRAPRELTNDYEQTIRYAKNENQLHNAGFGLALLKGQWRGLRELSLNALGTEGCETALWVHLVGAPFGDGQAALDGFSRMERCDPLKVQYMVHITGALLWMGEAESAADKARLSLHKASDPWLVHDLALGLAFQGQTDEAMRVADTGVRVEAESLFLKSMIAAVAGGDTAAGDMAQEYFHLNGPNDRDALITEAVRGRRNGANRIASMIDSRPFGHLVLLQAIYACFCGAPFDLESTPRFAEMLRVSGFDWPPLKPYDYPLKNW